MANEQMLQDPRIDPRIKAIFGGLEIPTPPGDVADREVLIKEASSEEALARQTLFKGFMDMVDTEEVAPSAGLEVTEHRLMSQPDGDEVNLRLIRPVGPGNPACVYYIHGGGMAFERGNPLAWPLFATIDDVEGLAPTVISVNECDPLRDEGIEFYRLLLRAGVQARCRQVMGTIHGTEVFPVACPDISRDTAAAIAAFACG